MGLTLTPSEQLKVWKTFDRDRNGSIDYDELKRGLRKLNVAPKNLTSILAQ
mgnify:CR=1 FL=1